MFSTRIAEVGTIPGTGSKTIYGLAENQSNILGLLNSTVARFYLSLLSPTLNFEAGDVGKLAIKLPADHKVGKVERNVEELIALSKFDWNAIETSWAFQEFPLLSSDLKAATVKESFNNWQAHCNTQIRRMQERETENNCLFIEAYGLQDELSPEVPEEQITLAHADAAADTRRLVSYAVGCMMGRYSLEEPDLIYANSGGAGFDPSRYRTFAADADGIIPVTDLELFDDDAANRFSEFVRRAWAENTHAPNLAWIAAQLGSKSGEMPVETIRRYFSAQFFKDHTQAYKKRPIYWLFSSGKQKAFECLVYLHRYNESTLSRIRTEYVTSLFGKLSGRIEYLGGADGLGGLVGAATSTAEKNKLRKQLEVLKKKETELIAFDDELRHYADMRINLDLDDGVKVNYGKFGNLLSEVRVVTGGSAE
jgi:type II restriction/modification system DNA methylase subunit YeeA